MGINSITLAGRLTKDCAYRVTQAKGTPVLEFRLAYNEGRRNDAGEWEEVPNYIQCYLFGNRAEALQKRLTKGTKVVIKGKLRYAEWTDKQGQMHSRHEIVTEDLEFMSGSSASSQEVPEEGVDLPLYDEDVEY